MKRKQCRNPKEKYVSFQKNKWYIEKKDNRALKFKQTMATNLGNTRNTVEKTTLMPDGRHLGILS